MSFHRASLATDGYRPGSTVDCSPPPSPGSSRSEETASSWPGRGRCSGAGHWPPPRGWTLTPRMGNVVRGASCWTWSAGTSGSGAESRELVPRWLLRTGSRPRDLRLGAQPPRRPHGDGRRRRPRSGQPRRVVPPRPARRRGCPQSSSGCAGREQPPEAAPNVPVGL